MQQRDPLWYKDAIIYELNIKGFYDSNGDGIGDFQGLIQKLPYLEDLGITAIWLLPFYPSPLRDDGYDIADYYTVSPAYGSLDDFKQFLDEAHRRQLKVITELVINHTSDRHPWFERARRAPKGSPERDFYVWSDDPQRYKDVRIIFQDFEASNWTWDPVAQQYYWHRFYSHQPDLNFDNPAVQAEIFNILDYWASMGIDGFRLDAVPYLFEREGSNCENLPETHAFLKQLRRFIDERHQGVMFLAEANMWPEDSASYFGAGDECHMNYHFPIMPRLYMSVKMEDRHPITDIIEQTPAIPDNCQWATFLRNHDELTLEMVTDEERDFMYKVYAKERSARINLGIRRRLAPLMENDRRRIELMNILLLSLPGTPVLYYGDEIGMGDNVYLGDRDGVRTPMQWDSGENAGFSTANPQQLYLPVVRDPEFSYRSVNVQRQQGNKNALLWWTKRVLRKRQQSQVFGRGDIRFLRPENSKVLAFVRSYGRQRVLVLANLSRFSESVQLDLAAYAGSRLRELFGGSQFPDVGQAPYQLSLSPYGYYWLEMSDVERHEQDMAALARPLMALGGLADIFGEKGRQMLENTLLPAFLARAGWLNEAGQGIEQVQITHWHFLGNGQRHFAWAFAEVSYKKGLPEWLSLPIAFQPFSEDFGGRAQEQVLGVLSVGGQPLLLTDAFYDEAFPHYLFEGLPGFDLGAALRWQPTAALPTGTPGPLAHQVRPEYHLFAFGDWQLKAFRRIDALPNPDLELKTALADSAFPHLPQVAGSLHFAPDRGTQATLALIEQRTASGPTAWAFVTAHLRRFAEELLTRYAKLQDAPMPQLDWRRAMHYAEMPELLQELLGANFVVRIARLGKRTASLHRSLASLPGETFQPEALSLHYQRSLFAGLKSQVRETFDTLRHINAQLPRPLAQQVDRLTAQESALLERLRLIFDHKIDAFKIRLHGNFQLEEIDVDGEEFCITHFDGDPEGSFSQRRLRRSPMRDVASLLRSLEYACRLIVEEHADLPEDQQAFLGRWMQVVYGALAAEWLTAYRGQMDGSGLLPENAEDLFILLRSFMMEKALQEIRHEARHRRQMLGLPVHALLRMLEDF